MLTVGIENSEFSPEKLVVRPGRKTLVGHPDVLCIALDLQRRAERPVVLGNWLTADLAPIRAEADPRLRWSSLLIAEPEGTRYVAMRGWRQGLDGAKTAAVDMS